MEDVWADELELLRCSYGLDGSLEETAGDDRSLLLHIARPAECSNETLSRVSLRVSLPAAYPSEAPDVAVASTRPADLPPPLVRALQRLPARLLCDPAVAEVGAMRVWAAAEALRSRWDDLCAPVAEESLWDQLQQQPSAEEGAKKPATAAATIQQKQQKLTKAQKRRMWESGRDVATGEQPRGHGWVDVIAHLSKTGSAATRT